ncbi:MAG: serine hydrolase [Anaerolineales bacterium]|nr:serine hydrolase [Anaerolineales bacterium]
MVPTPSRREMLYFHRMIDPVNWQFGGEKMRYSFLHRSEFLPHAVITRSGPIAEMEDSPRDELPFFLVDSPLGKMALDDYLNTAPVNGMIILHRGRIVFERYPRMRPFDKHALMSISKVFVSALVALLEARGQIDLRKGIEVYLPPLKESGWEGSPVADILDMASGINAPEVDEGFTNPEHPYYQFEASLGWLPRTARTPDSTYEYTSSLERKEASGIRFEYTSLNTFILSWLVESTTGLPLHEAIQHEFWQKIGAEGDALMAISAFGAPAAHAGLSACLRDVARFGLLFTSSGQSKLLTPILPPRYVVAIQNNGRPELFARGPTGPGYVTELHGEQPRHNIFQWDYVLEDGDFFKGGYGGQGLYISPTRDLVIAYFGTPFDEQMETHDLQWITRQMVHAGIFDD